MAGEMKFQIIGDASSAMGVLDQFSKQVKTHAAEVEGHFGGLARVVENFASPVLKLTALMGGGAMFKGAIEGAVGYAKEVGGLQRLMGGTVQQASVTAMAVRSVFGDVDTYEGAATKLVKTLNKNESAITSLGVRTRDVHGNFRDMNSLLPEVVQSLSQYAAGTERDAAAQAIFGRSFKDVLKYAAMTPEVMDEARKKARDLGLELDGQAQGTIKAYRKSMLEVDEVFLGLKTRVALEVMPSLTGLAHWFGNAGPSAIRGTVAVLQVAGDIVGSLAFKVVAGATVLKMVLVPAFGSLSTMVATFNATLVAGTIPTISAMGTQVAATSTKLGNLGGAMASVISPWTLGIVALAGIAYAFDYFSKAHERAMKKIEDSNAKAVKSTEGWVSETKRVVELEKDLANAKGTDARVKAQERLDLSVKGLLAQYPDLAKYMVDEKGNHLSIAEAIDRRNQAELVSLRIELAKAELAERNLKSGIDLRKEWNEAGSKDTKTVSVVGGMGEQVEANNHEAAMRYNREQIAGTEKELGQQALKTKGLRDQLTILTALDQKEGSKHWGGNTVKDSATSKLNQDLEAYKLQIEKKSLEDGHYQEFTAEQEKAWLAAHINAYNLDAKEKAEVMRRIAGDERAVLKSSHEEEMRRLKTELESFRTSKEEQLRIAQVMEAKAANPKEAEEARKLQEKIRQDIIQRDKQVKEIQLDAERAHEVSLLELEEQHVTQMEQRGEIDKATAIRWTLAIEDSKYQIEVQSLKDRLKVAGLELPEREKIEAQLQALADKHRNKSDATKAQGPKSAAEDYKVGVGSTWLTAQKSMLSGAEGAFSGFFASLTQKGSTFGQKTKALWMDVSGSVVGALSKMAAQELVLWGIDKAKLAWAEIRSAWETKDTAKTLTQNAVKSTSNTGAAATGFFASFAGMGPWGYALAAAAILAMFALLGSVTGRKVGGLVGKNGPEMTMLGEEGLEVVAPIHDFKDWARDFQYAGANMGFNLARHDDKMSSLQAQASSYGTAALQNGGGMADKYVDNRGAMFVAADSRQWSDMVHQGFKYRAKSI